MKPIPIIQTNHYFIYLEFNKVNSPLCFLICYVHHFNVTLLEATGCKQVCPPAVKLQKTLKASEVQPKFGSTQNQPESAQFKQKTENKSETGR